MSVLHGTMGKMELVLRNPPSGALGLSCLPDVYCNALWEVGLCRKHLFIHMDCQLLYIHKSTRKSCHLTESCNVMQVLNHREMVDDVWSSRFVQSPKHSCHAPNRFTKQDWGSDLCGISSEITHGPGTAPGTSEGTSFGASRTALFQLPPNFQAARSSFSTL